MPGDLNLKKSWNPALMKNQAKIWNQEQKAIEEFNKIKQREEELKKEKETADLIKLKYKFSEDMSKNDKLKLNKLDWMYQAPAAQPVKAKQVVSDKRESNKVEILDPMSNIKKIHKPIHKSSHKHKHSSHSHSHNRHYNHSGKSKHSSKHKTHDEENEHKGASSLQY